MARKAKLESNKKRAKLAARHLQKRQELKKVIIDPNADPEAKGEAMRKLQGLPKNSSPVRVRNRCAVTGRSRGFLRTFGLSRIAFRELAHRGMVPGVTKSSW
ncbi:MAG: 30S ribosomal protein S14 [Bacteriovoracaceae bacterium]|nr:30S ribosomal protein S14 [Bacteriovoracaceae bacterium]